MRLKYTKIYEYPQPFQYVGHILYIYIYEYTYKHF